jgi:hypothetical protein
MQDKNHIPWNKDHDFVCLYTYEFWISLWKIVRSSVILLLPILMSPLRMKGDSRKTKMLWPGQENTIQKTIIWPGGQRSRSHKGHYGMRHTALWSCTHIPNKYYSKNNYLTLRSKVKVPWRSLRYAAHHLMVTHPHTKYHWSILKDKNVMVQTRKYYLNNNYLTLRGQIIVFWIVFIWYVGAWP